MRKQTKLVAVLSAAALLAIGASMTSFAAQGWTEEGGTWVYYNKDGSMATDQWKKSGNNWYWLTSDGTMLTDQIVEDEDDYFYVDANGVMVTNQWVQVDNVDDSDEDAPSNWWYYFQGNGKAYTANESSNTSLKTINGKKYAFTDEGKMLFGWVDEDSTRQTDDSAWQDSLYYMGDEDDGAAAIGWAQIHVIDDELSWDERDEESEDQDYWFYFQSNGKKVVADADKDLKTKTINGKKYGFDQNGRMTFEWTKTGSYSNASTSTASGAANFSYFNDRDNGARVSKGWFKTVPSVHTDKNDFDDDEERWYYAYSVGKLAYSEFKTINSKRYCFDNSGQMLSDLQAIYTDSLGRVWNVKLDDEDKIKDGTELRDGGALALAMIGADAKERKISDLEDEDSTLSISDAIEYVIADADTTPTTRADGYGNKKSTFGVFYFGDGNDGALRTSTQNVNVEGESYTFYFKKDGDRKGEGVNGIKDNYLYQNGKRVKADKDNKYEAYYIAEETGASAISGDDTRILEGHVYYVSPEDLGKFDEDKAVGKRLYLVNTSGSISKGNKEAKDGNDMYYEVKNGFVKSYYEKDGSKPVPETVTPVGGDLTD